MNIREKIIENIDDVAEWCYNDTDGIIVEICYDKEKDELYKFIHCGNTIVEDSVFSVKPLNYEHNCSDCPYSDESVKKMSEKLGENCLEINVKYLQMQGLIDKDFYINETEEDMTVEDCQRQCLIDNDIYEWLYTEIDYILENKEL